MENVGRTILDAMKKSTGPRTLQVNGTSMIPMIDSNDHVTFRKKKKYKAGDIIVFERAPGTIITHRLLYSSKKYFYIKGDSTVAIDKTTHSALLGSVESIQKNNRTIYIKDGLWIYRVILLSYMMHRVWKKTGSYRQAVSSRYYILMSSILKKRYFIRV